MWTEEKAIKAVKSCPTRCKILTHREAKGFLQGLFVQSARVKELLEAEHNLSDAYLRIRTMLDAFDTPNAPTSEQVWKHTENKLQELKQKVERYEKALKKIKLSPTITFGPEDAALKLSIARVIATEALNPTGEEK